MRYLDYFILKVLFSTLKMKVEKSFTFQNSEKQDLLRMRINPSFYFSRESLINEKNK